MDLTALGAGILLVVVGGFQLLYRERFQRFRGRVFGAWAEETEFGATIVFPTLLLVGGVVLVVRSVVSLIGTMRG